MLRLLESPITRPLLVARFHRELGITRLREQVIDAPPGAVAHAANHMPIGIQLRARPWRERALLELGALLERDAELRAPVVHLNPLVNDRPPGPSGVVRSRGGERPGAARGLARG